MKGKALLIVPPCGPDTTSYPPYGALYIGTYLQNKGYDVQILNHDLERFSNEEMIKRIKDYSPDIIGFSAIVSNSYKYVKEISRTIKESFPDIFMILGGQLSYAANVVLKNTPIDVVVIGEGENTIVSLCEYLEGEMELGDIRGIAYREKNGELIYTEQVHQVKNIDDLSIPNYELIDMDSYLLPPEKRYGSIMAQKDSRFSEEHRKGQKSFTIMTGRGCQAKCTFCCRGVRGLRKHSPDFILDNMEVLIKKYNVGFFTFGDESFVSSKKWVLEFIEKYKERNMDVLFYILGARVDIVDRELIFALKGAGCFMIEYGYESGSQRMLDLIEKRTTVAENYRTHMLTVKEAGLQTVPAFIINMPGETSETISETIQFIKCLELDNLMFLAKYAQAQPGTPLYEYALLNNMITDEDEYLSNINEVHPSDLAGAFKNNVLFNFSGQPMDEVLAWQDWMYEEVRKDIEKRKKRDVAELSGNDYVKPGEYFEKAGGAFKRFLKIFIRKERKQINIFGKNFNFYYPAPANDFKVKKSFLKKLTNKYLNGSPANLEALKIIKIDDNDVIKQLKMPLRRIAYKTLDGHGKPQEKKKLSNGSESLLPVFMEEAGKYSVKRYESLRFVCDDIRKTSGKDVFAIEVGVLPQSDTAL